MASFDFAPLALRYAQDERGLIFQDEWAMSLQPFVLSVAERQRSEVEGRRHIHDGADEVAPVVCTPD